MDVTACPGENKFCPQILKKRGDFQRTLKIISDRHYTDIEVADPKGIHILFIGTVANLCAGNVRKDGVDPVFRSVDSHNLVTQLMELHCHCGAETAKTDD